MLNSARVLLRPSRGPRPLRPIASPSRSPAASFATLDAYATVRPVASLATATGAPPPLPWRSPSSAAAATCPAIVRAAAAVATSEPRSITSAEDDVLRAPSRGPRLRGDVPPLLP